MVPGMKQGGNFVWEFLSGSEILCLEGSMMGILCGSEIWCLEGRKIRIVQRAERSTIRAMCDIQLINKVKELIPMLDMNETIDHWTIIANSVR